MEFADKHKLSPDKRVNSCRDDWEEYEISRGDAGDVVGLEDLVGVEALFRESDGEVLYAVFDVEFLIYINN